MTANITGPNILGAGEAAAAAYEAYCRTSLAGADAAAYAAMAEYRAQQAAGATEAEARHFAEQAAHAAYLPHHRAEYLAQFGR